MKKAFVAFVAALVCLFAGFAADELVMLNWVPSFVGGGDPADFTVISVRNTSVQDPVYNNVGFDNKHLEDPLEVSSAVFSESIAKDSSFFFEFYNQSGLAGLTDWYSYEAFMNAVEVWRSDYPSFSSDPLEVTVRLIPEPSSGLLLVLGGTLLCLRRKRREEKKDDRGEAARSGRRTSWRRVRQMAVLCGVLLSVPSSVWAGNQTSTLTYTVGTVVEVEAPSKVSSGSVSGWTVDSNSQPAVADVSVVYGVTEKTQRPKVKIEAKAAGTTTCVIETQSSSKTWTLNITVSGSATPPSGEDDEPETPVNPPVDSDEPETPANPVVEIKYDNYRQTVASGNPQAIMLSYYDGPDTRGFTWQTDTSVKQGGVSVLAGDYSNDHAAFSNAVAVAATPSAHTSCVCYKASVSGLTEGVHTYRLGTAGHYAYGTFTVKPQSSALTILNISDVQTRDASKLAMWQNCVVAADRLLGGGTTADFIISGGDFFDSNGPSGTDDYVRWGVVADNARPAFADVPWIMVSGNHDTDYYNTGIMEHYAFASSSAAGCHAFTSGPLHVATVPYSSGAWSSDVEAWVKADLAQAQNATWRVLVMHAGPYTTGDHGYEASSTFIKQVTKICADYKVDLVLQAHDHTYSRTLPYRWSGAGYTTSETDSSVVNLSPATQVINGNTYYQKPEGTFYVSAGCAGHRVGEQDAYANRGATSSYTKRTYKIVTDTVKVTSAYAKIGDDGSKDVGKSMFAVLRVDGELLDYEWYVAGDNGTPVLFDVLRVSKYDPTSDPMPSIGAAEGAARVAEVMAGWPASLQGYVRDVETYTAFRSWIKDNGIDPQVAKESASSYFSFVTGQTGLVDVDQVLDGGVAILNVESVGTSRVRLTVGIRNCPIGERARLDALATMFGAVGATTQAEAFTADRVGVDSTTFERKGDGTVSYTVELEASEGGVLPDLLYLKAQLTVE